MEIILNNPYRILGAFTNYTNKEITANVNKIRAFTKVGKMPSFPSDMESLLPPVVRTAESVNQAISQLSLPDDKLRYALFWFINDTSIDDVAISQIYQNDIRTAKQTLENGGSSSSIINLALLNLIEKNLRSALKYYNKVFSLSTYRSNFLAKVSPERTNMTETALSTLFYDTLMEMFPATKILNAIDRYEYAEYYNHVKVKAAEELIGHLNTLVENAKKASTPEENLKAANKLKDEGGELLTKLKALLGESDTQYSIIADKLANQILNNSVEYHNNSNDSNKVSATINLTLFAQSIAVGEVVRDRLNKNIKTLQENLLGTLLSRNTSDRQSHGNSGKAPAAKEPDTIDEEDERPFYKKTYFKVIIGILAAFLLIYLIFGLPGIKIALLGLSGISALGALGGLGALKDEESAGGCIFFIISAFMAVLCFGGASFVNDKIEQEKYYTNLMESENTTAEDLYIYLKNNPNTGHKEEILQRLYNLEDQERMNYLNNLYHELGDEDIYEMIKLFADSLYQAAEKESTIKAWEEYQNQVHPDFWRDSEAKKNEIETSAWSTESSAWEQASKENTIEAMEKYLKTYPKGAHRYDADKKQIDLTVEEAMAGSYITLPMTDKLYGGGSKSTITIENSTAYTMTFWYSGPDSKKIVIQSHQTGTLTIRNGEYRVKVSLSDGTVGICTQTYDGGHYTASYTLETSYRPTYSYQY